MQQRGSKLLLLGGIAAGAALLFFVGRDVYDAQFLDWKVQGFSFDSGTLSLGIINGTPSSYTMQGVTLDIKINGTRAATAQYIGQLVIMPNATTTLNLKINPDVSGLLTLGITDVSQLIQNQDIGDQDITATGSAQVDGIMLPVDTTLAHIQA